MPYPNKATRVPALRVFSTSADLAQAASDLVAEQAKAAPTALMCFAAGEHLRTLTQR